eukprot:3040471-Pyramimonas_sp.AAC.1
MERRRKAFAEAEGLPYDGDTDEKFSEGSYNSADEAEWQLEQKAKAAAKVSKTDGAEQRPNGADGAQQPEKNGSDADVDMWIDRKITRRRRNQRNQKKTSDGGRASPPK